MSEIQDIQIQVSNQANQAETPTQPRELTTGEVLAVAGGPVIDNQG